MSRVLSAVVACALVSGCAYYNAMYNARRLTDQAEKAEEEGRNFDANTLWGQVTVKAETVIARHPDSRYVPEAYALMGRAHARLGNCTRARPALESALTGPLDSAMTVDAELRLAGCYADLGMHREAIARYQRIMATGGPEHQRAARAGLARSLRVSGRAGEAARIVDEHPDLPASERLAAFAASGRGAEVLALADSLIAARDSTIAWDSVIAWLAVNDRAAASTLVDRAAAAPGATPAARANRLLSDAARYSSEPSLARLRLERVRDQTEAPDAAAAARLELIRYDLRAASSREGLDPVRQALAKEVAESPLAPQAEVMLRAIEGVASAVDSSVSGARPGDMRVFLAAEAARDRLAAPRLAESLFRRIAEEWPESPYAPKALLAAAQLAGDTLLAAEVGARYPSSPYVIGTGATTLASLRALEDSLGAFADSMRIRPAPEGVRPAGARPGPVRAGTPTGPVR